MLDIVAEKLWPQCMHQYEYDGENMFAQCMRGGCYRNAKHVCHATAVRIASALVDWNNNYADDDTKCVLFHCGNWAKIILPDIQMGYRADFWYISRNRKYHGALDGRTPAGAINFRPYQHLMITRALLRLMLAKAR